MITSLALALTACGGGHRPSAGGSGPAGPGTGSAGPSVGRAGPTARPGDVPTGLYLHPPVTGRPGTVCGTAQNPDGGQYALRVVRGVLLCAEVRTALNVYFGAVQRQIALGYGYDGAPMAAHGWSCRPHVKGDVSGRSVDCRKGSTVINASILK